MQFSIDPISAADDRRIGEIIRAVGAEYGAVGDGFGPSDPEVSEMSNNYRDDLGSRYFVAQIQGELIGGAGIAPFGDRIDICEFKKLFILPEGRGLGIGRTLTESCLKFAKATGYRKCYLDTLSTMTAAIALYRKIGFKELDQPLDGTIHGGCDVWMLLDLNAVNL